MEPFWIRYKRRRKMEENKISQDVSVHQFEEKTPGNKLSLASKISYGMGDLSSQLVWTFVGTYLAVFYTDIVGLTPAVASAIMLGVRILGVFTDPIMGAVSERTRSKFGRFRPYIAFGAPFLAIFSILTFTAPFGNGSAGVIWATVIYVIASLLYTVVNVPYAALSGVMTEDNQERNSLNGWRSVGMNVGMLLVNFVFPLLMLALSAKNSSTADARGYLLASVIYCVLSVPMFFAVFKNSREVVQPANAGQKVSIKETLSNVFGNKYLMIVFLVMLIQMTAFMGRIAVASYYIIYCLGSFALIAIIMTIPSIGGALCSMLVVPFANRFGKKKVLMATMLFQGIGLLVVYFSDFENLFMVIIGHIIFGIFNVGFPVTLSMVADSVDYQELKTGIRTDGTAYAFYGLANKLGNAIGASFGVLLIGLFGYSATLGQNQSAGTLNGINIVVNLIPAILYFVGVIACWILWDLSEEKVEDIRKEFDNRRTSKKMND